MIWWIWLRFCFAVLIESRISFQLAGPMSNFPSWGTWNVNAFSPMELSLSVAFGRSLRPTYEPIFFIFAWHLLGTLGGRDGAAAMRMERGYLWIVAEAFSD